MTGPLFSVVIPTFNRPSALERCLAAIEQLDFDRTRFEVIVVNDGGSTVRDDDRQSELSLRVVTQANRGPASARNTAAAFARGQFLAFIDDDCVPANDWLTRLEQSVSAMPRALHGGLTLNLLSDNPYSQASQCLVDYVYEYYNEPPRGNEWFFASNNFTVSSAMFAQIGGFDESFRAAEDRDFCRRWRSEGWGFVFAREVVMYHAHHLTLGSLQRQHFQYGRGALPYWRKAAKNSGTRLKVEPLGFYIGMIRHPFRCNRPNPALLASLVLLSQAANAAGFAFEAARALARPAPIRLLARENRATT